MESPLERQKRVGLEIIGLDLASGSDGSVRYIVERDKDGKISRLRWVDE